MLIRAVEDLEREAAERVQMLEQKLQSSAKCLCEAEESLADKDRKIDELQKSVDYANSFGDIKSIIDDLRKKNQICEDLKQRMEEKKRMQTDEITLKNDNIAQLKNECKMLEEKANHADEQVAVRDNIIKDLRKEIKLLQQEVTQDEIVDLNKTIQDLQETLQRTKQLQEEEEKIKNTEIDRLNGLVSELRRCLRNCEDKDSSKTQEIQHLNKVVKQLVGNLKEVEGKTESGGKVCRICKGRSKVGFSENAKVQTIPDEEQRELLQQRDDIIQMQSETLSAMECSLNSIDYKETINELNETIKKRDDLIRLQTDTLSAIQQELETTKELHQEAKLDNERYLDEIKALKNEVNELQSTLEDFRRRAVDLQQLLENRDRVIQLRADAVKSLELELQTLRDTEYALKMEKARYVDEIKHLKDEINHLTLMSEDAEGRANNFQGAVDLYLNTINVLEASVEKYKMEINQQKATIANLQGALVIAKKELDETKQKTEESAEKQKYKTEIKRLTKQKRCYEEVVVYFKEEMQLMADQLYNLQETLTLSHEAAQEENCRLYEAFLNVQSTNEKLCCQLSTAEQKVLEEYQSNQLNAAKVSDLERLVSQKELDLGRHDQAICSIRETLQCSLQQNEELHQTIVSLNETIAHLQQAIKKYELDNCRSRDNTSHYQAQINSCKEKLNDVKCTLEEKIQELCKLEMAYNSQNRCLRSAQAELQEMKERQRDRQCETKCVVRDLKKQIEKADLKIKGLEDEKNKLQQQLGNAARKDAVKDVELKRYRKVVGDLKNTLVDLNKSLIKKNFKCNNSECIKKEKSDSRDLDDVCLNCPCEVVFYQGIVETLKETVIDLKDKLTETQTRNELLEREKGEKEAQQQERDREYRKVRELLDEKMKKAQLEESRYLELAAQFQKEQSCMRKELELKTMQLDDVKKSCQEINSSRCLQLAYAQEEVNNLKDQLNNLLRKHCALNVENERLHSQSDRMQNTVSALEDKSQLLKGQVEQYLSELQIVQTEKESLVQKNRELLSELRSLQCSYSAVDKQQSSIAESMKSLESELERVKCHRDEICTESKNIVGYFRDWLQEQKKINKYVMSRERNWPNTERMKEEYTDQCCRSMPPKTCRFNLPPCQKNAYPSPPRCHSSWSLGSQGTASMHESPCTSPSPNEESDWYSSTFRNDSDEEGEEDWVSKVEDLAAQVRRTNRFWKTKMESAEYAVSRDPNK
nr:unnamed protein product [Callosobruchus chinensis]